MDSKKKKAPDVKKLVQCPFCEEEDFDLEGLKGHLVYRDCEAQEAVPLRARLFG